MTRIDPSRGDHNWNERSDDERRDYTQYVFDRYRQGGSSGSSGGGGSRGAGNAVVAAGPQTPVRGPGVAWVAAPPAGAVPPSTVLRGNLRPVINEEATGVMIGGNVVSPNLGFSDAAEFTQRYGESELLETGVGLMLIGADIQNNVRFAPGWGGLGAPDLTPPMRTEDYAGRGNRYLQAIDGWVNQTFGGW